MKLIRPLESEYNPYFKRYIDQVDSDNGIVDFDHYTESMITYFRGLPETKHDYKYAPDKWSIKQVLMHIIDTERIFCYRLLVIIRGDRKTKIQSYNDDEYASNVNVDKRTMESLIEEFSYVRKNSVFLLKNMSEEHGEWSADIAEHITSARAIGYIILGHALHHIRIIKERYL